MKRTSKKWCKKLNIPLDVIWDPDGWDRTNYDYSFNKEKITKQEFINRLSQSTIRFVPAIIKLFGRESQ